MKDPNGLTFEQIKEVLKFRGKEWSRKPLSLWKKMHFEKSKVSFSGKK